MLDQLDIEVEHAEAIVEKGIELGVHSDGSMPDTKKGKIEAAHDIITLAIDSFVEDGVRPDAKGEDDEETENIRSTAKDILELFEIAGIKAVKKGKKYTGDIKFDEPPELEEAEDDEEEEEDEVSGDEAPFDVEDVIKGYWELTAATRIKKIKALKLDPEDDEDYNTLVGIAEAEEAADKPSSRVLDFIDELAPAEEVDDEEDEEEEEVEEEETEDEDEDEEEEEDEDDEDTGDGEEGDYTQDELEELEKDDLKAIWDELELDDDDFPKRFTDKGKVRVIDAIIAAQSGESEDEDEAEEEPWDGYDDSKEAAIKKVLEEQLEDEDDPLSEDQVEYVIEYEKSNKGRDRLVKWLTGFLEDTFSEEAEDDDEEEEVEDKKPAKSKSGKAAASGLVITRAQILEALENGKVTIS